MGMPGPTRCPFCSSSSIQARLPVQGLYEYECAECQRSWLVARPKRQARMTAIGPNPRRRERRVAGDD
jgi:hypothetical protein